MQTSDKPTWPHAFDTSAPAPRRGEPAAVLAPEPAPSPSPADLAAEEPERWDGMA